MVSTSEYVFLNRNKNDVFLRVGLIHRFKYGKPEDCGLPIIPFKFVGRKMIKEGYSQGYARHTKEEC